MTDLKKLHKKICLSSSAMHGEELKFMTDAFQTNGMSTVGENINEMKKQPRTNRE